MRWNINDMSRVGDKPRFGNGIVKKSIIYSVRCRGVERCVMQGFSIPV